MIEANIIQKSTTSTVVALMVTSSNMFDQVSNSIDTRKSNVSRPEMKPKPSIFLQRTYANVESNRLISIHTHTILTKAEEGEGFRHLVFLRKATPKHKEHLQYDGDGPAGNCPPEGSKPSKFEPGTPGYLHVAFTLKVRCSVLTELRALWLTRF